MEITEDFGWAVDARETFVVENSFYNYNRSRKSFTAWLQVDGRNVAMLRYLVGGQEYDLPVICDVEVREEMRGKGLAMKLIRLIEENLIGTNFYTSGGFTPEGLKAFGGKIPIYPWEEQTPKAKYRSMNFVHDWDKFQKID